ncbi:tetratricopeptide repeat protein [Candidatus Pelagibacter sp. Uisw_134_02]|uniref:tetratricopeptide repeat protein n=1 Tax=Candidatus Pelagibacter sp. Uisw_134_02 TaxID=3230990 RepID=UPI0039E7F14F
MIKKIFFTFLLLLVLSVNSYSAGSSDNSNDNSKTKTSYEKAVVLIKSAKKYEKKDKIKKANKSYEKALKLLIKSNKEKPNNPDTLNYLGFTTRKLGDYENGEKFYLQGLAIEPNHIGINEYLGELYVVTNRIDLAKERLKILENCNCKEYDQLREIIQGIRKSKY